MSEGIILPLKIGGTRPTTLQTPVSCLPNIVASLSLGVLTRVKVVIYNREVKKDLEKKLRCKKIRY